MDGTRTTIIFADCDEVYGGPIPSCAYCSAKAEMIVHTLEHGRSPYDIPLCADHNDRQDEPHPDGELIDLLNDFG